MTATGSKRTDTVKLLLDAGAGAGAGDNDVCTASMEAADFGYREVFGNLIAADVVAYAMSKGGFTALTYAKE